MNPKPYITSQGGSHSESDDDQNQKEVVIGTTNGLDGSALG